MKKFFLFCAGVDTKILEQCPSDENKYLGIGATVFFTGVLAFFSAGYALYTVFDNWFFALIFGLIWGMMIFNLDRYIVSSMKSQGNKWKDFGVAAPRLILAILLALVISKPLELKIFEKEINAELIQMEQEVFKNQEDLVKARFETQIADNQEQISILKNEIAQKTAQRDELKKIAIKEADGTGGSQKRNMGPIYRAKKRDADNAQVELDNLIVISLPLIQEKELAMKDLQTKMQTEIENLERTAYGGMAARMEALSRLGQKFDAIFLATIFITLLFIAVETAPIFVKLISSRSPYDYLLHEKEHQFKMANLETTTQLANKVHEKVKFDTETTQHRTQVLIDAEKELMAHHLKEKVERMKQETWTWKEVFLGKNILGGTNS